MLHLEILEVILVRCNFFYKNYQQDLRVLNTFALNKSLGKLSDISPKNVLFLKIFNSGFLNIEVWFTDQNYKPARD